MQRNEKIVAMQRLVDEGLKSGTGNRSMGELFAAALARAQEMAAKS